MAKFEYKCITCELRFYLPANLRGHPSACPQCASKYFNWTNCVEFVR